MPPDPPSELLAAGGSTGAAELASGAELATGVVVGTLVVEPGGTLLAETVGGVAVALGSGVG
jgi:hypothetical protein